MKTKDCYFQIIIDDSDDYCPVCFIITPKVLFEHEGCLDDSGDKPTDLPKGFLKIQSATYEFTGMPSAGRKKLLDYGAVERNVSDEQENKDVLNNVVQADEVYKKSEKNSAEFVNEMDEEETEYLNEEDDKVWDLKTKLQTAIETEDFMEAARVRDLIAKENLSTMR
jgi:hypothetical protein